MTYGTLREELENDPLERGYAQMSNAEVATDLNTEYRTRNTYQFRASELLSVIDLPEYNGLTGSEKAEIKFILQVPGIHDSSPGSTTREVLIQFFGKESQTLTNLDEMTSESISRAEELGLPTVRRYHVSKVRN